MCLAEVHVGEDWRGRRAADLGQASGSRVAFVTRAGSPMLPDERTVIQEGDLVHLLFDPERREDVERICEMGR